MIFVGGSIIRGEASTYSDIDLVVVYPKVETAYRESFIHRDWPIEAFIHDPETLYYFFTQVDQPAGKPHLAEMVFEGHELPQANDLSARLKRLANSVLQEGPGPLEPQEMIDRRHHLGDLVDDLREPRNQSELYATGAEMYQALADYFLRSQGLYSSHGKSLLRRLRKTDPAFFKCFNEAFESLFSKGDSEPLVALAESVASPHGGLNFESYFKRAPSDFRRPLPSSF